MALKNPYANTLTLPLLYSYPSIVPKILLGIGNPVNTCRGGGPNTTGVIYWCLFLSHFLKEEVFPIPVPLVGHDPSVWEALS